MSALNTISNKPEHGTPSSSLFRIEGGRKLQGTVLVSGGKNPSLAVLPAALLCDEPVTIENLPMIEDVYQMRDMMIELGARVFQSGNSMTIDPAGVAPRHIKDDESRNLRASYYLLGAMLGRFGEGNTPFPGGCNIGSRPIDLHFKGFEALGAETSTDHGRLSARATKLVGAEIYLDFASVGATINIMLAAARAEGQTTIVNAAREPHIVDLANVLNAMGGNVKGAGTEVIRIKGVSHMHGCTYAVVPDQILTGTLMIAAAATRGDVLIKGAIPTHMEALTAKLLETGARVEEGAGEDSIRVWSDGNHRHVNIKTLPYPGFPTDLQQPMSALLSCARGVSVINETIYESRYQHLNEMRRMGAKVRVNDRLALIEGVSRLSGCAVEASDLRAGAALVVAGMMAEGITTVSNIHFIDRGYECFEQKLSSLGAKIDRIDSV